MYIRSKVDVTLCLWYVLSYIRNMYVSGNPHPRIPRGDSARYIEVASGITPGYPRMGNLILPRQMTAILQVEGNFSCPFLISSLKDVFNH